jgi:hypothetical protein
LSSQFASDNNALYPSIGADWDVVKKSSIEVSSMGYRTVFQVDQAAPAHQVVLRDLRECREKPDMDRRVRLCARSYHQETAENRCQPLHNPTGLESHRFRTNPFKSDSYCSGLQI